VSGEDISFNYQLTGVGWAMCTVGIYGQKCVTTASYLSDALQALVCGINHILLGGSEARFRFDEEPGEYRWILKSIGDGCVSVRILEFDDLWAEKPDAEGKPIFEVSCPIHHLGGALLVALNRLLEEHGLDGYKKQWGATEFPTKDYLRLCSSVGTEPSKLLLVQRKRQPKSTTR
jgi:hypothetical protein